MTSRTDNTFPQGGLAIIVGASGGIGKAIAAQTHRSGLFTHIIETGRTTGHLLDLLQEDDIAALAQEVQQSGVPLRLVFDATGYLHGPNDHPEKSWSAIDPDAMAYQFAINSIGPALLMKHLLPLLPREGKSVFATICAKVGSVSDNRLGGWYGYRASKAALNQLVKTASIELARKRPQAVCVALHPGTVETQLSAPFAKNGVTLQTPEQSAQALWECLTSLSAQRSGELIGYDGATIPF